MTKKKTKKAIAKVSSIKDSVMVFIPKKLDFNITKEDFVTIEVLDNRSLKITKED